MAASTRRAVRDAAAYFDRWLAFRVGYERVPGAQAAILHDGEVVLSTAHGLADVERGTPLTPAHLFRIASHSKTFTATAVLQLVERDALRLDDTAGRWLAFLRGSPIAAVTVRELLAHGGGVVRDGVDVDFWQLTDPFPNAEGLARAATHAGAAVLARNQRFKYSNIGYGLLGRIIEQASGRPYADHVAAHITGPLGLVDTAPDLGAEHAGRLATGYSARSYADARLPIDQVPTGALESATGFVSNASEVVRYLAAHLPGDDRLLGADAKRLMQRTEWVGERGDASYGLGLMLVDVAGRRTFGHSGGWPGHITRSLADPDSGLVVSVCTNAIDGGAALMTTVALRLVDLADEGVAAAERAAVDPARFVGRFANLWGVFDIVDLGGRLHRIDPTGLQPVTDAQRLDIVDDDTLRVATGSGFGSPGEPVDVERAADGTVAAVRSASMTSYPLDRFGRALAAQRGIAPGTRLDGRGYGTAP